MARRTAGKYLRYFMQPATYLGVGMLIFIYATLAYLLAADRRSAEDDARTRGENLVNGVHQILGAAFGNIDFNLHHLRREHEHDPKRFENGDWPADFPARSRHATEYLLADADGKVLYATNPVLTGRVLPALADALHAHKTAGDDDIVAGRPFVLDDDSAPKFALSIPIRPDAAGSKAAIAAGLVDIRRLSDSLSGIDLGIDGGLLLFGRDGYVRFRMADGQLDRRAVGRELPVDRSVISRMPRASAGVFWRDITPFDGKRRLLAYRMLDNVPLGAVVAQSVTEVYRRADERARIEWIIALSLTTVVMLGVGLSVRREWRLVRIGESAEAARSALLQSEERYRKAAAAVNEGLWDWDIETGAKYLSPRWKALLGYADEELRNEHRTVLALIHPDDLPAVEAALRAHFDEGKIYNVEYRLRRRDGRYIWVHSRGKADRDASGRPVRMVGAIADISDRKLAEEKLHEEALRLEAAQAALRISEERYRKVEDALGEGVWDLNILTGEYHLSARWKEIIGYRDNELRSAREEFYRRIHPDDDARVRAAMAAHLERDEPYRIDLRLRCKDGGYKWIHARGKTERDAHGKPVRILGTIEDISERKQAEEVLNEEVRRREAAQAALARINAELEQRIAVRSEQLASEMRRREEAQMRLAQVHKLDAIGQMTAGIAHDFNNLLSVINGGLEFVKTAADRNTPADPELVEATMRATRRGADLVSRLLAFARLSPLAAEPVRADQLVLDTLRLLQRTLGETIEIETRLEAGSALVRVDRNQFINALVNLALNARDAMPDGGTLTISTMCRKSTWAETEGPGRWPTGEEICVTVEDTGTGMPEEVRARATEPFFTTKAEGLGSGLGLNTVLGFVEQSGGHLDIDSTVGKGTRIDIHLPRIESGAAAADGKPAFPEPALQSGKMVLLVEDDPDVRVITAAQLKSLGYQVHAAADAHEAITVMESPVRVDVMLTDVILPGGVDGLTLVKEALRTRPGMGVLCMSGYDPGSNQRNWLTVQNIRLLEKPFTGAQLAGALNDTLVQTAS